MNKFNSTNIEAAFRTFIRTVMELFSSDERQDAYQKMIDILIDEQSRSK